MDDEVFHSSSLEMDLLPNSRQIWWSNQSAKVKKLIFACTILSVLTIVFSITTIAVSLKKTAPSTTTPGGDISNQTAPVGIESTTFSSTTAATTRTTPGGGISDKTTAPEIEGTTFPSGEVCNTRICTETAYDLRQKMDEDVNPCENFYSYACGRFAKTERTKATTFHNDDVEFLYDIKDILDTSDPNLLENPATKSAVRLYQKCLYQDLTDFEGTSAVRKLVKAVLGTDWPIAVGQDWKEEDFDWMQSLARLIRLDQSLYVAFKVAIDTYNPSFISSTIHVNMLENLEYPLYLTRLACTVYYPDCKPNVTLDADFFQVKKGSFSENKLERTKYTIEDLDSTEPEFDWRPFFVALFNGTGFEIKENYKVFANTSDLQKVRVAIEKNKRTAANNIGWIVVQKWGKLFSSRLRNAWPTVQPLENICFSFVTDVFEFSVGRMYINKRLPAESLAEILNITRDIKQAFKNNLINSQWLDTLTKSRALKKLERMGTAIAAPDWIWNDEDLRIYYKDAEILEETTFFEASIMAVINKVNWNLRNVDRPLNKKTYWPVKILQTNAWYHPLTNTLYLQVGILRRPFYVHGRFRYINLASLGSITGHEIVHGFDWNGKNYDENGLWKDWLTTPSLRKFTDGAICFEYQYNNITERLTGLHLNGSKTLSENIADNGGLAAAVQAYKYLESNNSMKLSGFQDMKDEQIFFLAAAQVWCSKYSKKQMYYSLRWYTHAPDMYRAIVPFQNLPEFSRTFNCELGSKMNPYKKCKIW